MQPAAEIIVLSDWKQVGLMLQAADAGATGFVSINGNHKDIIAAIKACNATGCTTAPFLQW